MEILHYFCLACATLKSLCLNRPSSLISTFSNSTIQLLIQTRTRCICAKCSQNPYCYCLLCNSELNIYGKVHTSQTTLRKHINLHFLQKRAINCGFMAFLLLTLFGYLLLAEADGGSLQRIVSTGMVLRWEFTSCSKNCCYYHWVAADLLSITEGLQKARTYTDLHIRTAQISWS